MNENIICPYLQLRYSNAYQLKFTKKLSIKPWHTSVMVYIDKGSEYRKKKNNLK